MSSSRSNRFSRNPLSDSRERGLALVSVLWTLFLLSALAASAVYEVRTESFLTHRRLDVARAEAAADAGIAWAVSNLSDELTGRHPSLSGGTLEWSFDAIPVAIDVHNEQARIDINSSSDALLVAFLQAQQVGDSRARELVSNLREWQQQNRLTHLPRRRVQTLGQLQGIPGWDTSVLRCWSRSLTVFTGQQMPETLDATPPVLVAIAKVQDATAPAPVTPSSLGGRVVRVIATAAIPSGATRTVQWVGRLTGDRKRPAMSLSREFLEHLATPECASSAR